MVPSEPNATQRALEQTRIDLRNAIDQRDKLELEIIRLRQLGHSLELASLTHRDEATLRELYIKWYPDSLAARRARQNRQKKWGS